MKRIDTFWSILLHPTIYLNTKINNYLVKLGFRNYTHHYIHGSPERLHWSKKNDFLTWDIIFNTRSGEIWIPDDVIIGVDVKFLTGRHIFENGNFRQVPLSGFDIHIGHNCWIASDSIILGGVTLGDNCLVCAGSVVTKSFPSNTKIAGNPAKEIGRIEEIK